jgi:uncharacterized 2Fe-2S/4Fe-4S cluster protein (DUF4445 family)
LSAAAKAGVYIQASCGGDGVCGKCKVKIEQGEVYSANKAMQLKGEEHAEGYRLACQSSVIQDLVVSSPPDQQETARPSRAKPKTTRAISARSLDHLIGTWQVSPPVEKRFLALESADPGRQRSRSAALMRAIKGCYDCAEPTYDHPELLRELPFRPAREELAGNGDLLRGKRAEEPDRIIAVEPGDTTDRLYGLAVDIGTTTVCGVLIDLNTGEVIADSSAYNEQISCGEDVISRIIYSQRPGGLKSLQEKVVRTINKVIETVCQKVIISPSDISYIMAAGNTVMSHLLLGHEPQVPARSPLCPDLQPLPADPAAALGIHAHPSVRLFLYPSMASYVGGDIVAGVHACQMYKSRSSPCSSTSAPTARSWSATRIGWSAPPAPPGPAFEGGGIKHGMRANRRHRKLPHPPGNPGPDDHHHRPIKPCGICGSGLIAIVSELLEARGHRPAGQVQPRPGTSPDPPGNDGYEYVLAWGKDSLTGEDIAITEVDLDNLIRAKGAMYAGYDPAGIGGHDLHRSRPGDLAGNFGAYIDLERAICIGLLPDIDRERSTTWATPPCRLPDQPHRP